MSNSEKTIPCPKCGNQIPFDIQQLLNGVSFSCPSCNSSISLENESKSTVQQTLEKLEELKKKA